MAINEIVNMEESRPSRQGLDWVARNLGYESIQHLAEENGYSSEEELARDQGFKDFNKYLQAKGYASRMDRIRRVAAIIPKPLRGSKNKFEIN